MTIIPSNLSRAPNSLMTRVAMGGIGRTQVGLLAVSQQMSSGRLINSFSDDGVKAATITTLSDSIARRQQQQRNLDHADASLAALDQALGDANDTLLEARTIASQQVNVGSSPEERAGQAVVVNSLVQTLLQIGNRRSVAGHIFGGTTPGTPPIESLFGGYRYVGQGAGLLTDIDLGSSVPITLGQPNPIGETSVRVRGTADLDPSPTTQTRVAELNGARGVGVRLGVMEFSIDGGARVRVDMTGADTLEQVATRLRNAIGDEERRTETTILGAGGVGVGTRGLTLDIAAAAAPATGPEIRFFDPPGGSTAADLGLTGDGAPPAFTPTAGEGAELQARLSWRTPIAALRGLGGPLGRIAVVSLGQRREVDLSTAQTLGDLRNLIQGTGLGLRVEINVSGNGIDVVNEVAAGRDAAMSIEEISDAGDPTRNLTASRLGIRTLMPDTRLADLNDGRGVRINDSVRHPITGLVDPALSSDLRITLGDGRSFDVDLRPQDTVSVRTLLARINEAAADPSSMVNPPGGPAIAVPAEFEARLGTGANGIELVQSGSTGNAIRVEPRNNSPAADDLGFLDGSYDPGSGTFRAQDRGRVRVNNLFTALIDLRDALERNDTAGITLAGERIEAIVDRVSQSRALVGGYSRRVADGKKSQEDLLILDQTTRSTLQDLDYAEAATRLSRLQTQLQAGYTVTSQLLSRSLLDFLG